MVQDHNTTRSNDIKLVQHNMNGARVVSVELLEHRRNSGADILLLQETPLTGDKVYGFDSSRVRVVNSSVGEGTVHGCDCSPQ